MPVRNLRLGIVLCLMSAAVQQSALAAVPIKCNVHNETRFSDKAPRGPGAPAVEVRDYSTTKTFDLAGSTRTDKNEIEKCALVGGTYKCQTEFKSPGGFESRFVDESIDLRTGKFSQTEHNNFWDRTGTGTCDVAQAARLLPASTGNSSAPAQSVPAPPSKAANGAFEQCFERCRKFTERTKDQCFDTCNK